MEKIIKLLSDTYKIDFARYKHGTLKRRIEKRMSELGVTDEESYLNILKDKQDELSVLLSTLLIGVTEFFRDPLAFKALEQCLKKIFASKKKGDTIRIWSVGCATGEEAYSIAILLSKILKEKLYNYNIQIFATDVNSDALKNARKGIFPESALKNINEEDKILYFNKKGNLYEIKKNIRQMMLFTTHDITNDPPFVKQDLISCRNLLIYLDSNLQREVFSTFHYGLNPNGYLFLGKSENINQLPELFYIIDKKHKIYQRKISNHIHHLKSINLRKHSLLNSYETENNNIEFSIVNLAKETLFATFEYPIVIINDSLDILSTFGDTRLYMGVATGSMSSNIVKMLNKELRVPFRTLISKIIKSGIEEESQLIEFKFLNQIHYVKLQIKPIPLNDNISEYFMVIFQTQESGKKLAIKNKSESSDEKIIELEHELTATREQLQSFTDELESNYEELQSLNEELQSVNEELKSSNEELETSNEELLSTNEELSSVNEELNQSNETLLKKEEELGLFGSRLELLINSINGIVWECDAESFEFTYVSQKAVDILGYPLDDWYKDATFWPNLIHRDDREYALNLCSSQMKIKTYYEFEYRMVDVYGEVKWIKDIVTVIRKGSRPFLLRGIMFDITKEKVMMLELKDNQERMAGFMNAAEDIFYLYDENFRLTDINASGLDLFKLGLSEKNRILGKSLTELNPGIIESGKFEMYKKVHQSGHSENIQDFVLHPERGMQFYNLHIFKVLNGIGIIGRNITAERKASLALKENEEKYRLLNEKSFDAILICDRNKKIISWNRAAKIIFGYDNKEIIGKSLELLFPNYNKLRFRIGAVQEKTCITKNGSLITVELTKTPFSTSSASYISYTLRDITKRKIAESSLKELTKTLEEKVQIRTKDLEVANNEIKVLLKEMHHRVKNNLQIISSLLNLQANAFSDERVSEVLKQSRDRIQIISKIHENLYKKESLSSINLKSYIEELIEGQVNAYDDNKTTVSYEVSCPSENVNLNFIVPIGLLLNELVTNSLKHAFKEKEKGLISVNISETKNNHFKLVYSDNGSGFDEKKLSESSFTIGNMLIESFIEQLTGTMDVKSTNKGVRYSIEFDYK